jgi:hypothetical protein
MMVGRFGRLARVPQRYKMYTSEELDEISKIDKKGEVGGMPIAFRKAEKYKINMSSNKRKGLAIDTETGRFMWNYPHLSNRGELPAQFFTEPKYNGTNIGILRGGIIRTRGSIDKLSFTNTANIDILAGKQYIGIASEVWEKFKARYEPILKEGIERGYVDNFGYFKLNNIVSYLDSFMDAMVSWDDSVEAVFGELISRYNPIPVDRELKYGLYNAEWEYVVFDILVKTKSGDYEFLDAIEVELKMESVIKHYSIDKHIRSVKHKTDGFIDALDEEGVIVKSSEGYYKVKIEAVLEYEREMGRMSNIVQYAVNKIFTETGFTMSEIEAGAFSFAGVKSIIKSVEEEIKDNGISLETLDEFYKSVGGDYYRTIKNMVEEQAVLIVADILLDSGVHKEVLYLEIPKYVELKESVEYSEKRKKYIPVGWYGKLVSRVIGKILNR